jgi:hypothetical protein
MPCARNARSFGLGSLASLACLLGPAAAAWHPATQEQPPLTADFGATIALSEDVAIDDRWHRTLSSSGVQIASSERFERGQPFRVLVFFQNHALDAAGHADIRAEIAIRGPDGELAGELKDVRVHQAPAPQGLVVLGQAQIALGTGLEDPTGTYELEILTRDVIAGREQRSELAFEIAESIEGESFGESEAAIEAVSEWSMSPAALLETHRVIPALCIYARAGHLSRMRDDPNRAFFRAALDARPHLFRELGELAQRADASEAVQLVALQMLATCRSEAAARLDALEPQVRERVAALGAIEVWNPFEDPIEQPGQLDEIWGSFFATGQFALVARLLPLLEEPAEPEGEVTQADMIALQLHGAARWSMRSIAQQHELLRGYLAWLAEHPKTPEPQRAALREMLAD